MWPAPASDIIQKQQEQIQVCFLLLMPIPFQIYEYFCKCLGNTHIELNSVLESEVSSIDTSLKEIKMEDTDDKEAEMNYMK